MNDITLVYLIFVLGVLCRVVIPYLMEWTQSHDPFDARYLVGQLLGAIIAAIPFIFTTGFMNDFAGMELIAVFGYGWGFTDIGRRLDKGYTAWRNG